VHLFGSTSVSIGLTVKLRLSFYFSFLSKLGSFFMTHSQDLSLDNTVPAEFPSHRRWAAAWGLIGFSLLIGEAFYKVTPFVLELFQIQLTPFHWIALIGWSIFMAYSEGYRGFQKHYSPRFAARVRWLLDNASTKQAWLAPFFCMCFIGTTRKRKIVAYCLTSGIALLVVFIRMLPQPWRGIIDVGVIVGLGWGLLSIYILTWQTLTKNTNVGDPEVA
jgi:hypothetical protein